MSYTILIETTKWKSSGHIPNHTYIINEKDKCVGYIKEGTSVPIKFSKPMMFDRRYRKFITKNNVNVDFEPQTSDSAYYGKSVDSHTTITRSNKNMSKSKTLNWNDRFALIDYYKPTDAEVCTIFGVSNDELSTARNMRNTGVITATNNIDVGSYGKMFGVLSISKTSTKNESRTVNTTMKSNTKTTTSTSTNNPQTASKKTKHPMKRGRKGNNILEAFKSIPSSPISVDEFAEKQGVSVAVLRQSKRFDTTGIEGRVHVKKDKNSKTLVIWRSADE